MVAIYWANANKLLGKDSPDTLLARLPKSIQAKILAYTDKEEQTVRCISKLMLSLHLEKCGHPEIDLEQLEFNAEGKPYFPYTFFTFNNTHSGPLVLSAAVAHGSVGIDAEKIRTIHEADLIDYFTFEESKLIERSADPQRTILSLWTRKEAVLKASGMGVFIDYDSVEVINDVVRVHGTTYYLQEIMLHPDYVVHVATDFDHAVIDLHEFCPGVSDFKTP